MPSSASIVLNVQRNCFDNSARRSSNLRSIVSNRRSIGSNRRSIDSRSAIKLLLQRIDTAIEFLLQGVDAAGQHNAQSVDLLIDPPELDKQVMPMSGQSSTRPSRTSNARVILHRPSPAALSAVYRRQSSATSVERRILTFVDSCKCSKPNGIIPATRQLSVQPGARLGPYEILSAIGAGGMGEVYRARDTKLDRDVAIKVLPDLFASDADRLARFTREAQTLASLNHPNIAIIHGLEQAGDVHALVMELVDGEDLSQRIAPVRSRSTKRCRSQNKSPRRSKRRTSRASSTAISSPPTSSCAPTAR